MDDRDNTKQQRRRVEELVPASCRGYATEREQLWDRIATDLTSAEWENPSTLLTDLLIAMCNALQYQKTIARQPGRRESYGDERQRIEALLDEISDSEVVRQFQHSIDFFGPGEYECPHNRRRKLCERLYAELSCCRQLLPSLSIAEPGLLKRVESAIEFLNRHGIDPRTQRLDQLCSPSARDSATRLFEPVPKKKGPGAPMDHLGGLLLDVVVGPLTLAGLNVRASCLHLADVRRLCFGLDPLEDEAGQFKDREDVAETLAREWRGRRSEDREESGSS